MRCATCGIEIDNPAASACPNCGQPLPATPSPEPQTLAPLGALATPPAAADPTPQPAPSDTPAPTASWQQTPRLSGLLSPLPPVRKRRFRFVVPLIAGVAVLAVIVGLLALLNGQENGLITGAANSTATASAPHTPVAVIAYQNSFAGSANGWPSSKHCTYGSGGLHVTGGGCLAPGGSFDNVGVAVTVEQLNGSTSDTYGVTVRAVEADTRYDIVIDSNSQWGASRCDAPKDQNTADCTSLVPLTSNSAIHGGLNTKNTIDVRAQGSHFDVTVNGTSVGSFDDTLYADGQVGLIADGSFTCVFTDFTITRYA